MMNDPNPNDQVNTRVDDPLNPPLNEALNEALTKAQNRGLTDCHAPHPFPVSQDGDDPASTPAKTPSQDGVKPPRATTVSLAHSPGRTFNGTAEVRSEIRSEVRSEIHSEATGWATVVDTLAAVLAAGLVLAVGLPWGEALPPVPARVASILRTSEVVPAGQRGNEEHGAHGARLTPMARSHAFTMTGLGVSAVEATGLAVATTPVANLGALGEQEAQATGRADVVEEVNDANEAAAFEAFSPFASSLPSAVNVATDNPPTQPTVQVIGRLVLTQGIPLTTHDPDWVSTLEADAKAAVRSGEWAKALENAEATFRRQWDAPPGVTMGMLTVSRRETYPTPYAQWKQHQGGAEALAMRSAQRTGDPVQMALSTFSRTYLFIDTDNPVQAAFFERFVTGAEPLLKAFTERLGRHLTTKDVGVENALDLHDLRIVFVKGNLALWRDRLASLTPSEGALPLPLYFDQGGSLAARLHVTALPTFVHLTAEVMDLWTPALTADGNPLDPLPDGWGLWPKGASTKSTAVKTTNALPTQETHHE
ncbi:MAG: hypothetical protein SOR95_06195 [Sutterella sp.]|nr:hypothetical protein [Sutterella sp.]